jgi:hypothetical protein
MREAAYTSPSGERLPFTYEDVTQEFDRHTKAFNFPNHDGTFVQDLGRSGRRFPLQVIFHGADYDQEALLFEQLVSERGVGRLEHPMYGVINVIPVGTVSRSDKLKSAGNQAIINITFFETGDVVFPDVNVDPVAAIRQQVIALNDRAVDKFNTELNLESLSAKNDLNRNTLIVADKVDNEIASWVVNDPVINQQYTTTLESLRSAIRDTSGFPDPGILAGQLALIFELPAQSSLVSIFTRLRSYRTLTESVISTVVNFRNDMFFLDLMCLLGLTGSALSAVSNTYTKAPDVFNAVEQVLDLFDEVTEWRDEQYEEQDALDTGELYDSVQKIVAIATGYLLQISFTVAQEHRVTLSRDRNVVELVMELYGSIDSLDFFIETNDLTGDEIISLPQGLEIVYYL